MRERGLALLLALGALAAFYGLWLRPAPSLDPEADTARPTSAERRGNGYAALFEWLQRSGVQARSLRERYTALAEAGIPPRGNLMVLSLPGVEMFRSDEFAALDSGCDAETRCSSMRRCWISRVGQSARSGVVTESSP